MKRERILLIIIKIQEKENLIIYNIFVYGS